jgi:anti-sigma regulatory factor (Ser/Thr protein kinase)
MRIPATTQDEHRVYFQAFNTSPDLAEFLLNNRWEKVHGLRPEVRRVLVVVGGLLTVKPHHVTTLACLLEEYRLAGVAVRFESGNAVVYQYLDGIRLLARFAEPATATKHEPMQVNDPTSFGLWPVEPEGMNDFVRSAYQHFKGHFFQDKSLDFLTIYLGEMFNNVFDHAFATTATERIAFAMLQYYPTSKRLLIAVSDFGMGIPQTVNRYLQSQQQEPITAPEALRKALELRFTAQSRPHNQGRGLDTLRTGVRELNGTFTIQTTRAIYHISQDGTEFIHEFSDVAFPGTTLAARIYYKGMRPEENDLLEDETALF